MNQQHRPAPGEGRREVPAGTTEKTCPVCKASLPLHRACCSHCGHWFRTYFVVAEPTLPNTPRRSRLHPLTLHPLAARHLSAAALLILAALTLLGLVGGSPGHPAPLQRWAEAVYQSAVHESSAHGT